jgi:low affinity Fe/Cu permease
VFDSDRSDKSRVGGVARSFRLIAGFFAQRFGNPWSFVAALALVIGWAVTGPFFDYSENWQLVINTSTTIITFLMVFLIQATQNWDSRAVHLKLDELIRSSAARNIFADLENATEEELDAFNEEFRTLRQQGIQGPEAARRARTEARRASRPTLG